LRACGAVVTSAKKKFHAGLPVTNGSTSHVIPTSDRSDAASAQIRTTVRVVGFWSRQFAMLLNEFLKEHRKVEEQETIVAQQRKDFEAAVVQQHKTTEALVARLNEQEARIQKVSAQVEMRNSASQTLVKNW
jgi:hypothetical protein